MSSSPSSLSYSFPSIDSKQKLATSVHVGSGGGSSEDDRMTQSDSELSKKKIRPALSVVPTRGRVVKHIWEKVLSESFRKMAIKTTSTMKDDDILSKSRMKDDEILSKSFRKKAIKTTSRMKDNVLCIDKAKVKGLSCGEGDEAVSCIEEAKDKGMSCGEDEEAVLCIDKDLNSCIKYCSLLPLGYEFEQDKLIQLWISQGLIEEVKNELMEDVGGRVFNHLREQNFIVPCGFDHFSDQVTYKVGDAMSSSLEKEDLAPVYHRTDDGKLADVSTLCANLSLTCKDIDHMTFEALKKCENLRTQLLLCDHGSSIKQIPRDLFFSLKLLLTLDLSHTHISELPSSVGNLSLLRFLDISHTPIKWLPETIDHLMYLETLRLRGCLALVELPRHMNKLTNLRHLDLDIACQLMSMPAGIGSLTRLQTLRAFLVGREEGCHIGELKNLNNLRGSFCISRLENVMNKEGAIDADLSSKQYIDILELRWENFQDLIFEDEEEILEYLQPHSGLKELRILFFGGPRLPKWINNQSFEDLVRITLFMCRNFELPSLGELPSLKFLSMIEMNNVRDINSVCCKKRPSEGNAAFPKLEKLTLDVMLNLEKWTGVENGDFPCLLQLTIRYCPKVFSLPLLSHLHSLKYLEIGYCQELLSLAEIKLSTSLEHLIVRDCPNIKERCCKGSGEDWFKIAHVPSVWIDNQEVTSDRSQGLDLS